MARRFSWVKQRALGHSPRRSKERQEPTGPRQQLTVAQRAMLLSPKYKEEARRAFPLPGEPGYTPEHIAKKRTAP